APEAEGHTGFWLGPAARVVRPAVYERRRHHPGPVEQLALAGARPLEQPRKSAHRVTRSLSVEGSRAGLGTRPRPFPPWISPRTALSYAAGRPDRTSRRDHSHPSRQCRRRRAPLPDLIGSTTR